MECRIFKWVVYLYFILNALPSYRIHHNFSLLENEEQIGDTESDLKKSMYK